MAHAIDETTRVEFNLCDAIISQKKNTLVLMFWIVNFVIGQVPTEKGMISHQVVLDVLVPDVFILGPKDLIVDRGTTLSLVCIVENVSYKWRHRCITQIESSPVCVITTTTTTNARGASASASAVMARSDKTKERQRSICTPLGAGWKTRNTSIVDKNPISSSLLSIARLNK